MRNLFSSPLGANIAPIGNFKRGASGLGLGAAVSGLGAVFGGLTDYLNAGDIMDTNKAMNSQTNLYNLEMNKQNNQANREIAEAANKANKQLQDEQNAWNLEQWLRQNEYNAPSQQVARLKAAGINPLAVFGSGSMVPASSLTSAPSQPTVVPEMKAGHVEPYYSPVNSNFATTGINAFAAALNSAANVHKVGNDAFIANEANKRENALQPYRIEQLQNMAKKEGVMGDLAKQNLAYEQAAMKFKIAALQGDLRAQSENFLTMQQQRENIRLNNRLAEVQLAYAPKLKEVELNQYYATVQQIKAQTGLINANKLLTDEQRLHEIEKKTSTIIDNGLKGFDFNLKTQMKKTIMNTMQYDADSKYWDVEEKARNNKYKKLGPTLVPWHQADYLDW